MAAYQRAVRLLPAWLDAPRGRGRRRGSGRRWTGGSSAPRSSRCRTRCPTGSPRSADTTPGWGCAEPIDRFMRSEDPYGTLEFVEFGVQRGEVRDDIDPEMVASMLDWLAEKFQDALVSEDLDPGLIHRRPERRGMRIKEFVEILRDGIFAREPDDDGSSVDGLLRVAGRPRAPRDAARVDPRRVRARRTRCDRYRARRRDRDRAILRRGWRVFAVDAEQAGIDRLLARACPARDAEAACRARRSIQETSSRRPRTSSGPGTACSSCRRIGSRRVAGGSGRAFAPAGRFAGPAPRRARLPGPRRRRERAQPCRRRGALRRLGD